VWSAQPEIDFPEQESQVIPCNQAANLVPGPPYPMAQTCADLPGSSVTKFLFETDTVNYLTPHVAPAGTTLAPFTLTSNQYLFSDTPAPMTLPPQDPMNGQFYAMVASGYLVVTAPAQETFLLYTNDVGNLMIDVNGDGVYTQAAGEVGVNICNRAETNPPNSNQGLCGQSFAAPGGGVDYPVALHALTVISLCLVAIRSSTDTSTMEDSLCTNCFKALSP